MKNTERVLKALANRRRLEIIRYLHNKERANVGDIAKQIKLSFKSTSKHISVLKSAEIIEGDQVGLTVFCKISEPVDTIVRAILVKF